MILPFNMEAQTQSNWCWAATSKSVSKFYSATSTWTQCKVAAEELARTCCSSPVPTACNIPWYLDRSLSRTNNYLSLSGPLSWVRVLEELQKGLVVGARVGWLGGGGHFMVIHGATFNGAAQFLHIDDPIYGKSILPYNQFLTNYQGSGRWTHSYLTKKYTYSMWFKDTFYDKNLLRPIKDLQSHAANLPQYNEALFMTPEQPDVYDLPHYSYILGLNEIKANQDWPTGPKSLRLLKENQQSPEALFEVTLDRNNPELIQMNTNKIYFSQLQKSLGRLQSNAGETDTKGELRLIKVPALNIEAFWLSYDNNEGRDQVAPIKIFEHDDRFDWTRTYSRLEFSNILNNLALQIPDDDLLGG